MSSKRRKLLKNKEYAYTYAFGMQDLLLAAQIRRLRQSQNLNQEELAERAGMRQARISLLESGDYSQWNLKTLRKIAEALDVGLEVQFAGFHAVVDRMESESIDSLHVLTRRQEQREVSPAISVADVALEPSRPVMEVALHAASRAIPQAVGNA